MRPIKMKFAVKLGLSFVSLLLVGGLMTVHRMYRGAESILELQITDRLQEQAFQTMDKIDRVLYEWYMDARSLAADPVISARGSTPKQLSDRLAEHLNNHNVHTSLTFYGPRGARVADATGTGTGVRRRPEDRVVSIPRGRVFVSGVYHSSSLEKPVLYFAFPVKDGTGAPLGVVVSRMLMDVIHEMARQAAGVSAAEGAFHVDLVDREGVVLFSNYHEKGVLQSTSEDWDFIEDRIAGGQMAGNLRYTNPKEKVGEELLVFAHERGYRDFDGNGWSLIIFTPTSVVFAPAVALRNNMILILCVGGSAILFLVIVLLRKFIAPLAGLRGALEAFGKGDAHVRVAVVSDDEIGEISESFNTMAAEIENAREASRGHARNLEREVAVRTSELHVLNEKLEHDIEVRRRTEESLRRSEEKWFKAFHSAPNGIVISTFQDGRYLEVNEAYLLMSGYSREELIGRSALDIGIWADPEDRIRMIAGLREQGQIVNQEARFRTKSGRLLDVLRTVEMIDYGDEPCLISVTHDISERKIAERDLRRSKDFIETIFNSMHDAIAIVNAEDLTIIDANRVFVGQSGLSKAEIVGKSCHAITHRSAEPCAAHGEACPITAMLKSRTASTLEHCHDLPGGRKECVEVTAAPILNEKGKIVQAVYITRDITERKLAEENIRNSEERYRSLFDSTLDGVYRVNAEGVFTQMNPAGARIFGYESPEDIIGRNALEYWSDPRDREVYRAELRLKKSVSAYHMAAKKRDGKLIDLETTSRIIEDQEGVFLGITGILRDVSERKLLEAEQKKLIQLLRTALAEVRTLSGMLPICSSCKKIRDDKGYWSQIESYISQHSEAEFSHGICPECAKKMYEELDKLTKGKL